MPAPNQQLIAITAANQLIHLGGLYQHVRFWTDSGAADIYLNFQGQTATVAGANTVKLQPGIVYNRDNVEGGFESFAFIGASAAGKLSVDYF